MDKKARAEFRHLQRLGVECARLIDSHAPEWRSAVTWLQRIPICREVRETADPNDPRATCEVLGRPDNSPRAFLVDIDDQVAEWHGPVFRRLLSAWTETEYRLLTQDAISRNFTLEDAKRVTLLVALMFDADFSGTSVELSMPWKKPSGSTFMLEGRSDARDRIANQGCAYDRLVELLDESFYRLGAKLGVDDPSGGKPGQHGKKLKPCHKTATQGQRQDHLERTEAREPFVADVPVPAEPVVLSAADTATGSVPGEKEAITHGTDFAWLIAHGAEYHFAKGQQARVIKYLYESWEEAGRRDGCGMSEETLGEEVGSSLGKFRIQKVFAGHPALGTILVSESKGQWSLNVNDPRKPEENSRTDSKTDT